MGRMWLSTRHPIPEANRRTGWTITTSQHSTVQYSIIMNVSTVTIYSLRNKTEYCCTGYSDCAKGYATKGPWLRFLAQRKKNVFSFPKSPDRLRGTASVFSGYGEFFPKALRVWSWPATPPSNIYSEVKSARNYMSTLPYVFTFVATEVNGINTIVTMKGNQLARLYHETSTMTRKIWELLAFVIYCYV